jgi:hypothetical protein
MSGLNSAVLEDVLAANDRYAASFGDKGELPMPPGRQFAILTKRKGYKPRPSRAAFLINSIYNISYESTISLPNLSESPAKINAGEDIWLCSRGPQRCDSLATGSIQARGED